MKIIQYMKDLLQLYLLRRENKKLKEMIMRENGEAKLKELEVEVKNEYCRTTSKEKKK